MQGKDKGRGLQKLAGAVTLGTGFLGLAMQPAGAVLPNQIDATSAQIGTGSASNAPAAAGLVREIELDAIRRSGSAKLALDYIRANPDPKMANDLVLTLPKAVAIEVRAGLASALTPPKEIQLAQSDQATERRYQGQGFRQNVSEEGGAPAGAQYGWGFDINPGDRGGSDTFSHAGGY